MGRGAFQLLSAWCSRIQLSMPPIVQDIQPLPENDKATLRSQLVPAIMLWLSNPSDKVIRSQIAESVSLIAELDFPVRWGDLILVRVYLAYTSRTTSLNFVSL